MRRKQALHGGALVALAAAVDQPDQREARVMRGVQVVVDDGDDVAWGEGVKIDRVFDGDPVGIQLQIP